MGPTAPLPHEQGHSAESLAADYLTSLGWRVLERNYKTRAGEVDLIVERDETLVFVEVRYRRSSTFGSPEETITRAKRRRVVLAAVVYAAEHRAQDKSIRFDVVAITRTPTGPQIEHIEGAFDADLGGNALLTF